MNEPYIGAIVMFGGNFAPSGWALCNGQLLAISSNTALFSILGTTFGGDGIRTFGLPNLQGRVPIHPGSGAGLSTYVLGEIGGAQQVTLNTSNLPPHSHPVNASSATAGRGGNVPTGNLLATASGTTTEIYAPGNPGTTMSQQMIGPTGSGIPVSIIQPYQCVNFIIALVGIFPSRN
jgi:microcystin-dependent protein